MNKDKDKDKKKSKSKLKTVISPKKLTTSKQKLQFKKVVISPKNSNHQSKCKKQQGKDQGKLTRQFCEQLMNWGIKSSNSYAISDDRLPINDFVYALKQEQFENMQNLKMKIFDYVIKKRIIRDIEYQTFYQLLSERFPKHEKQIKQILVQILAALDQ